MGFSENKKNRIPESAGPDTLQDNTEGASADAAPPEKPKISRSIFRKAALKNIAAAAENASADAPAEEEIVDDFDYSCGDVEVVSDPEPESETPEQEPAENIPPEKKPPRKSFSEIYRENKKLFKKISAVLAALLGICAGIYIYGCITVPKDVMGRNIYIEGVNVSDLTYDEALSLVQTAPLLGAQEITLSCRDQSYVINGADVGLTPRFEDTVQKAMDYGKSGNRFLDGLENAMQLFRRHTVIPNANLDEAALRAKITEFGIQIYGELVHHQLEIGDGIIVCTPGHTGFDENTDTAYAEILDALENERFRDIPVTLQSAPPRDYTAEDIGNYVYRDAADAYYERQDNEIVIIDEVPGRYVDLEEAAPLAAQLHEGGEVINIPFYYAEPEITAEYLQEKLFNDSIGSYSTNYGSSTANRCANIANAASKINGIVMMPGDVFSFNDTVGPRSVENGFYTAKEYSNGQTVDGIGGGTCQVSSTLYNAVLYSDLSIISRTNHMFPVSYCPIGQDATVSDSGVDFKFMNSMDYPIKISAEASGYTITVSIIGTQRDDPRTVEITNKATPVGSDQSVHSVRYVYNSEGELIQTDDLGNSYYMSHNSD